MFIPVLQPEGLNFLAIYLVKGCFHRHVQVMLRLGQLNDLYDTESRIKWPARKCWAVSRPIPIALDRARIRIDNHLNDEDGKDKENVVVV